MPIYIITSSTSSQSTFQARCVYLFFVSQYLALIVSQLAMSIPPNFSETLLLHFCLPKELLEWIQDSPPRMRTNTSDQLTIFYIMTSANQLRLDSMMTVVLSETSTTFLVKTGQALQGQFEALFICLPSLFSGGLPPQGKFPPRLAWTSKLFQYLCGPLLAFTGRSSLVCQLWTNHLCLITRNHMTYANLTSTRLHMTWLLDGTHFFWHAMQFVSNYKRESLARPCNQCCWSADQSTGERWAASYLNDWH